MKRKNKISKKIKSLLGVAVLLAVIAVGLFVSKETFKENVPKPNKPKIIEKKIKVIDPDKNDRNIVFMIDNVAEARPQHNLSKAYMIYELPVEANLTRLLAVFKGVAVDKIGPVRSSRHYYLDYALENDAIYTHFGYSPQAIQDIRTLKINYLDGATNAGSMFWRDSSLHSAPHNAYTSTEKVLAAANKKKYRTTTEQPLLLNYVVDDYDLTSENIANDIKINYTNSGYTTYKYDAEKKVYLRSMSGKPHMDAASNTQLTAKNIIIYQVSVTGIANDPKGRINLGNIGSGKGYYVTNGKYIEITWTKESRSSQTVYRTTDGKELKVNDGVTFIQIQPKDKTLTFS